MNPANKRTFLLGISTLAVAALLGGCKSPKAEAHSAKARTKTDAFEIALNGSLSARVKAGHPGWQDVNGTFQVAARIEADEMRLARVSAPVSTLR